MKCINWNTFPIAETDKEILENWFIVNNAYPGIMINIFSHYVIFDDIMIEWIENNIEGQWYMPTVYIDDNNGRLCFSNEADSVLFKLTWQ